MKPRQMARRRPRAIERVISLTRVSTVGQADNTSHEVQQRSIEEFCQRRNWNIVAHFEEIESGALYLSRVETQAALEMIERGEADALVLYDMTRYGRDVEYQHKILKRIIKAGGQLQFATFPLEYDEVGELTPEYEQVFNAQGGASSVERKFIKRRLSSGKKRKIDKGIQLARTMVPYGWKIVDKKAIIRGEQPPELEGFYLPVPEVLERIVPAIFTPYSQGASLGEVAEAMNDAGIPTPRGGRLWRPCGVRYILQNPVYMGRPAYGRNQNFVDDERMGQGLDKIYVRPREIEDWKFLDTPTVKEHFARPDIAPFLVEESVWWECQKRLAGNRAERSGRKDRKYPLTGLLRCHLCGRKLVGRIAQSGRYRTMADGRRVRRPDNESRITRQYVCVDKVRFNSKVEDRCEAPLWNAALVEEFACEAILHLFREPTLLAGAQQKYAQMAKAQPPTPIVDKDALVLRLEAIKRREQVTAEMKVEARLNGTATAPYDAMLLKLAQERVDMESQIRETQAPTTAPTIPALSVQDAEDVAEVLSGSRATDAQKNAVYDRLIERIEICPPEPDAKYKGRASGVHIQLRTEGELGALLEIRQLKTKRRVQLSFFDKSSQAHK